MSASTLLHPEAGRGRDKILSNTGIAAGGSAPVRPPPVAHAAVGTLTYAPHTAASSVPNRSSSSATALPVQNGVGPTPPSSAYGWQNYRRPLHQTSLVDLVRDELPSIDLSQLVHGRPTEQHKPSPTPRPIVVDLTEPEEQPPKRPRPTPAAPTVQPPAAPTLQPLTVKNRWQNFSQYDRFGNGSGGLWKAPPPVPVDRIVPTYRPAYVPSPPPSSATQIDKASVAMIPSRAVRPFSTSMRPPGRSTTGTKNNNANSTKKLTQKEARAALAALSTEQQRVLNMVRQGHSVFFTGCAGTGKSFLLKAIMAVLEPAITYVTALTGVAALNIGGRTLHSFAGIGMGKDSKEKLLDQLAAPAKSRWLSCKTLIIDEVSMMSEELFDKLDYIARAAAVGWAAQYNLVICFLADRRVRNQLETPFGGIQLVLSGDFFQLPPVARHGENSRFCFQSTNWSATVLQSIELKHVFRQQDREFVHLLAEVRSHAEPWNSKVAMLMGHQVRTGALSPQTVHRLQALDRPLASIAGIEPTRLHAKNAEVDDINNNRLMHLSGAPVVYRAVDMAPDSNDLKLLDATCIAPKELQLKPGAQVMLLRNLDPTHVNGSRGVVVDIDNKTRQPRVRFLDGSELKLETCVWEYKNAAGTLVAQRTQIPLKLAWAITIHKSQGLTIDWLEVNLASVFEAGQAYVALSRARTLDGLRVTGFDPKAVRSNLDVARFYLDMAGKSASVAHGQASA